METVTHYSIHLGDKQLGLFPDVHDRQLGLFDIWEAHKSVDDLIEQCTIAMENYAKYTGEPYTINDFTVVCTCDIVPKTREFIKQWPGNAIIGRRRAA